jgi:hypothetical protein
MRRQRIGKTRRRANEWGSMFFALVPEGTARVGRVDA